MIPNTIVSELIVKSPISRIKRFIFSLALLFSSEITFTVVVTICSTYVLYVKLCLCTALDIPANSNTLFPAKLEYRKSTGRYYNNEQ